MEHYDVETIIQGNGLLRVRNLDRLQELQNLELPSNSLAILERKALQFNTKLRVLNLSYNSLAKIETGSLSHLKQLQKLNLGHNQFRDFGYCLTLGGKRLLRAAAPDESETALKDDGANCGKTTKRYAIEEAVDGGPPSRGDVAPSEEAGGTTATAGAPVEPSAESNEQERYTTATEDSLFLELQQLPGLTNLDLSWNGFKNFGWEDVLAFFQDVGKLEVLYFQRNPGLPKITNYRRHMIYGLPDLKFLDEAPVGLWRQSVWAVVRILVFPEESKQSILFLQPMQHKKNLLTSPFVDVVPDFRPRARIYAVLFRRGR